MQKQVLSVVPKGIVRNTPDKATPDGALLEAINMRFRDGGWRGTGDKTETGRYLESTDVVDKIYHHPVLPINTYVIHNTVDNNVYIALFTNGVESQSVTSILDLTTETFDRFSHLGNNLIVWCDETKHILYWKDTEYIDISELPLPNLAVGNNWDAGNTEISITDEEFPEPTYPDLGYSTSLDEWEYWRKYAHGYLLNKLAENRESNLVEGFVVFRVAYKLFDGSYILHNVPLIHHIAHKHDFNAAVYPGDSSCKPFLAFGLSMSPNIVHLYMGRNYISDTRIFYEFSQTQVATLKNFVDAGIIESFDVFSTRLVPAFDYSKPITEWTAFTGSLTAGYYPPVTENLEKTLLEDSQYYRVASVSFSEITEIGEHATTHADYYPLACNQITPNFKSEVSAEMLLPADSFTHHKLLSDCDYLYNQRLHIGNVKNVLSAPINNIFSDYMLLPIGGSLGFTYNETLNAAEKAAYLGNYVHTSEVIGTVKLFCEATINTKDGIKTVRTQLPDNYSRHLTDGLTDIYGVPIFIYIDSPTYNYAMYLNPLIIYPDYRATTLTFSYEYSGTEYLLATYKLKPNVGGNFAYYTNGLVTTDGSNGDFYPIKIDMGTSLVGTTEHTPATVDDTYTDSNRMQCSGIVNALYWDAINSYRFGSPENEVIAIEGVQQAMSDAAFGQYPLYIFSKSGIFTISHGTGEVLYSSIQPLNNEILLNRDAIKSISGSIVYATKEGLKIISGSSVLELSQPVEGSITNQLASNAHFYDALTALNLPQINNYRSLTDFLTYLQTAKIFYDVQNKEIIVSNSGKSTLTSTIIKTTTLNAGGSGYAPNDTFTIDGGTTLATGKVLTVIAGSVATYEITTPGLGYAVANGIATTHTSGSGTGLKVNITELLPYNQNTYNYSYVYNLETKTWTTITEVFDDEMTVSGRSIGIKSACSLAALQTDYTHKLNYLDTEDTTASTVCKYLMLQTRPLNLGTLLPKRIDRMVLRALFDVTDGEYAVMLVYGSNDLVNWNVITYQQILEGGDVYLTRLMGNYKWFSVVFACEKLDAIVQLLDVILHVRFSNLLK